MIFKCKNCGCNTVYSPEQRRIVRTARALTVTKR